MKARSTKKPPKTHSPFPWKVVREADNAGWRSLCIADADGEIIANLVMQPGADNEAENAAAIASVGGLVAACNAAIAHIEELRDAWMRGAIDERDGQGGTRSNRNGDVERMLRDAIAKAEGAAT